MSTKKDFSEEKVDILGQPIDIGCHVAVPRRNSLLICKVTKISPKMVHVKNVDTKYPVEFMIRPTDAVRLDGPDVLAYILKA